MLPMKLKPRGHLKIFREPVRMDTAEKSPRGRCDIAVTCDSEGTVHA